MKIPSTLGFKYPTVEQAYNYLFNSNKFVHEHRALPDAIHEAEIVRELINRNPELVKGY